MNTSYWAASFAGRSVIKALKKSVPSLLMRLTPCVLCSRAMEEAEAENKLASVSDNVTNDFPYSACFIACVTARPLCTSSSPATWRLISTANVWEGDNHWMWGWIYIWSAIIPLTPTPTLHNKAISVPSCCSFTRNWMFNTPCFVLLRYIFLINYHVYSEITVRCRICNATYYTLLVIFSVAWSECSTRSAVCVQMSYIIFCSSNCWHW